MMGDLGEDEEEALHIDVCVHLHELVFNDLLFASFVPLKSGSMHLLHKIQAAMDLH